MIDRQEVEGWLIGAGAFAKLGGPFSKRNPSHLPGPSGCEPGAGNGDSRGRS